MNERLAGAREPSNLLMPPRDPGPLLAERRALAEGPGAGPPWASVSQLLRRPGGLAEAVLLAEILGAPRVMRPWRPGARHALRAPRIGS
ncbi:hypothetical protein [Limnochorda pilosa]|uniref:Uncharacterized protein n=1 Tax=Limnochorda pilosa TaxID=1555112 RepID=A0A0K2SNS1_LIMPI|nr:hypothetical protein [Limnochorda pilosa]BAS28479.1 hypothetical protein LIP_2649 [Limnochorda pilosa]